jgi:hypothetical protein
MSNDENNDTFHHETPKAISIAERVLSLEFRVKDIASKVGISDKKINVIEDWIQDHKLAHKDFSNTLERIEGILLEQEERHKKEKELAIIQNDKNKGKVVGFIKNAKEVVTFIVLVFSIITAVSLWFYKEAKTIEQIKSTVTTQQGNAP